jgi:hypothetical protein
MDSLNSVLERVAAALERIAECHERLADHFAPSAQKIVGTPYVANKLGCTTVWITDMIRRGEIPMACVVPGTGNGRVWKLYRDRIEAWIKAR